MGENLKCCRDCGAVDCRIEQRPVCNCTAWVPVPVPALPTMAEFDGLIVRTKAMEDKRLLRGLQGMVEAEECKRAIEAAECMWTERGQQPWYDHPTAYIFVWDRGDPDGAWDSAEARVATWPEARDWALEQKARREVEEGKQACRERIANAGATLREVDYAGSPIWYVDAKDGHALCGFADMNGVHDTPYYERAARLAEAHAVKAEEWSKPIGEGWTNAEFVRVATVLGCLSFGWKIYNRTWLGGVAYGKGRFNVGTERIWLGDGPMPH